MFHKELKLVQDKVIMEECWESHWELQTEANLVFVKDQGWFYQMDSLRVLFMVTLRVQGLYRVILLVIQK